MSLAKERQWTKVLFECDSLLSCNEVISSTQTQLWAIPGLVDSMRQSLVVFREWKVAWTSRKCNGLAHSVAKRAVRFGVFGFVDCASISEHIRFCDMHL